MGVEDWFLRPGERGNEATQIDSGAAWTDGNLVVPLVHGATYFARLVEVLGKVGDGDHIRFTDWRGDGDEPLVAEGHDAATVLADLSRRGADVRGLLWRSHSDRLAFSAKENRRLAREVNAAGGEVLLDERVRRGGSHHQKLVIVRHATRIRSDVAFVGGIDLGHGRRDDDAHRGDRRAVSLDPRYGPRPPWHDVQVEVHGPAIADLDLTFRERWSDPTPLNHSSVGRGWLLRLARRERRPTPLSAATPPPPAAGTHSVQVLRTYPSRHPRYSFAPDGERSVARAFAKAVDRARRLIYFEDQYFWSQEVAEILARALRRQPDLRVIGVLPRYPDKDGRFSGPPARMAQQRAIDIVRAAGGDRVAVYDLENEVGTPIYVHAKVCVIDDVWASVGSDNLNRRSWTHDSEVSCAIIDSTLDQRSPADPGGLGDGSRRFARQLRISLWAEHLGRSLDDPELVDPARGYELWRCAAAALDHWAAGDKGLPRPRGRARLHQVTAIPYRGRWWADLAYRLLFDPDGRPPALRIVHRF
jgi:phosphatidylserine/phosphatidylglycerophosphate/cardiolipin synthase-like enzyme